MRFLVRAVALVSLFLLSTGAYAQSNNGNNQETQDPGANARFQWGPLRFTPGIAITDVGVDNNVFNDPDNRLSDTTAAIGPAINLWTNLGPVRVAEKSSGQYLYFKRYENQRSWNTANELKLDMPLNRIRPFAVGSYVNTRQRPGFEIDSRARATANMATFGSDLRLSGKTTVVMSVGRTTTAFDQNETFLGRELAAALNRYTDSELLQLRYTVTPLTTFVVTAEANQDRFAQEHFRNADSVSVRPGFEFKPFALISGSVAVGFRHFNVLNDALQDYQGAVASVDAKYAITTTTLLGVKVNRDITFSYDELHPYYALTDTMLQLTQRFGSSWDVVFNGSRESLAYRGFATDLNARRTDRGQMIGVGIGYYVGETLRVGFDVNSYQRRSQLAERDFDGVRAGASVTYGTRR